MLWEHISTNSETYSGWKEQPGSLPAFPILQRTTSKNIYKNNYLSEDEEIVAEIFKLNHAAEAQDYQE